MLYTLEPCYPFLPQYIWWAVRFARFGRSSPRQCFKSEVTLDRAPVLIWDSVFPLSCQPWPCLNGFQILELRHFLTSEWKDTRRSSASLLSDPHKMIHWWLSSRYTGSKDGRIQGHKAIRYTRVHTYVPTQTRRDTCSHCLVLGAVDEVSQALDQAARNNDSGYTLHRSGHHFHRLQCEWPSKSCASVLVET